MSLREPRLIEATSLLGALSPLKRRVTRLFANPYYFRFYAHLDLLINLDALTDHQQGTALYELMMLR